MKLHNYRSGLDSFEEDHLVFRNAPKAAPGGAPKAKEAPKSKANAGKAAENATKTAAEGNAAIKKAAPKAADPILHPITYSDAGGTRVFKVPKRPKRTPAQKKRADAKAEKIQAKLDAIKNAKKAAKKAKIAKLFADMDQLQVKHDKDMAKAGSVNTEVGMNELPEGMLKPRKRKEKPFLIPLFPKKKNKGKKES